MGETARGARGVNQLLLVVVCLFRKGPCSPRGGPLHGKPSDRPARIRGRLGDKGRLRRRVRRIWSGVLTASTSPPTGCASLHDRPGVSKSLLACTSGVSHPYLCLRACLPTYSYISYIVPGPWRRERKGELGPSLARSLAPPAA